MALRFECESSKGKAWNFVDIWYSTPSSSIYRIWQFQCLILKCCSPIEIYRQFIAAHDGIFKVCSVDLLMEKSYHDFYSFFQLEGFFCSLPSPSICTIYCVEDVNLCGFLHVWIMDIIRQLYDDFSPFCRSIFCAQWNHSYDVEEMENKPLHADLKLVKATPKEKLRAQAQTTKDFL